VKGSHNTDEIMYTIAITLVVAGSLCYHVCNRSIDPRIAAPVSIAVTYLFALIIVALLIAVEQRASRSAIASAGYVNWATGLVVGGAFASRNRCGFRPTIRCTIACRFFDAVVLVERWFAELTCCEVHDSHG